MNNTYIQDKLLEKHICRFNDGECNCDCYIAGMTDYHNHIVEKVKGMERKAIKNFDTSYYVENSNGYNEALSNILSILQNTNPKE